MPGFFVGAENLNLGPLAFRVIAFIHQTISPVRHQYNLRMFQYLERLKPILNHAHLTKIKFMVAVESCFGVCIYFFTIGTS